VRWGYDKTTIDDVARRAGVAKGTIYLLGGPATTCSPRCCVASAST
jgi:hypothetical protein